MIYSTMIYLKMTSTVEPPCNQNDPDGQKMSEAGNIS